MTEIISTPNPTTTDAKPRKERRISKRMQQALTLLATRGMTQRDAAAKAGMTEWHLSRELKKPQIQVFIARKSAEKMQLGVLRASQRFVELIDADSEHVSATVTTRLLTSEGILRSDQAQVSVNIDIKAGYVIDLSEPAKAARNSASVIEHDPHETISST